MFWKAVIAMSGGFRRANNQPTRIASAPLRCLTRPGLWGSVATSVPDIDSGSGPMLPRAMVALGSTIAPSPLLRADEVLQ